MCRWESSIKCNHSNPDMLRWKCDENKLSNLAVFIFDGLKKLIFHQRGIGLVTEPRQKRLVIGWLNRYIWRKSISEYEYGIYAYIYRVRENKCYKTSRVYSQSTNHLLNYVNLFLMWSVIISFAFWDLSNKIRRTSLYGATRCPFNSIVRERETFHNLHVRAEFDALISRLDLIIRAKRSDFYKIKLVFRLQRFLFETPNPRTLYLSINDKGEIEVIFQLRDFINLY